MLISAIFDQMSKPSTGCRKRLSRVPMHTRKYLQGSDHAYLSKLSSKSQKNALPLKKRRPSRRQHKQPLAAARLFGLVLSGGSSEIRTEKFQVDPGCSKMGR